MLDKGNIPSIGCANCHQMDSIPAEQKRQVGTDLRHVADKLSPAFINTWVWAPKAFRPSTKMPHFFMLENNSSEEELRRTRSFEEAHAKARTVIDKREREAGKDDGYSNPQIKVGAAIAPVLARQREQLASVKK